ncbi:hypothetical protein PTMSG1_05317 [Pyrenophora teres f. maculata]|nr:hypothetical protein PTMSG1_05317 [Pyrenophora teres f. maculata]
MSRRNNSPVDSSVEEMLQATISKQGRRISEQASEIAKLKGEVSYLEAELAGFHKEVKHWKSEHHKAKAEAQRHAGDISKLNRERKAHDNTMNTVRDDASKEVRAMQEKLQRELKKREKHDQATKLLISQLRQAVNDKECEIEQLVEKYAEVKYLLDKERNEMEDARSTTCRTPAPYSPPHPSTGKFAATPYQSQLHRREPAQSSKAGSARIAQLEKEVRRLKSMHADQGCEEYQSTLSQQLGNALEIQKAAEAEAEGLRHLGKMNEMLKKRREVDAERIVQLLSGKGKGVARAVQMEMVPLCLSNISSVVTEPVVAQQPILQTSSMKAVSTKPMAAQPPALCLSGMQTLVTEPLAAQKIALQLSDMQALTTQPVVIQQSALQLSAMQILATEPVVPLSYALPTVVRHDVLCLSGMQAVSTTPHVSADTQTIDQPSANPSLITATHDSGDDIMGSSATPSPADVSIQKPDALPNVALTINIKPSEKRNWALLQYVQHIVSTTSSLDINGPLNLVQQFVTDMEKTEKDHVEQASLAKEWEKVAAEHRGEVDALKELMKQGKCGVPQHRDLALKLRAREHELEAKESQFQMHLLTQKLLAREEEAKMKDSQS